MYDISKMLKKILALFLASVVLFSVVTPVKAQEWYNQSYEDWKIKVFDTKNDTEIFGERYTYAQVQWIVYSLFALVTSSLLNNNSELMVCLSANSEDVIDATECTQGTIKFIDDLSGGQASEQSSVPPQSFSDFLLAERDLSAISYVRNLGNNFKLTPEARAQDPEAGYGYNALSPVRLIWEQSRNAAYALFAIISVIFAFMIMFRVKISPQAVISVQSALPKLVLTVLLVTFSYAIAGLMIDLMYLVIGVLSLIFNPWGHTAFSFALLKFMMGNIPLVPPGLTIFLYFFIWAVLTFFIMLLSILGMLSAWNLTGAFWGLLALIVIVFVGILTIWWALKTTWILFKAAVSFLVLVMFAPLQLTLGALVPSIGFGTWIRQLVANLAVFPTVGILFLLAWYFLFAAILDAFLSIAKLGGIGETLFGYVCTSWVNPGFQDFCQHSNIAGMYTADFQLPFLGNMTDYMSFFYIIISIILVSMIPKSAEMVKGLIEGKEVSYGSAIGEAIQFGKTAGQAGVGYTVTKFEKGYDKETPVGSALRSAGIIRK